MPATTIRLAEPADLRILVSSIQVIPDAHCFEKWANFPRERQRLFEAIQGANGGRVMLLSGDRHLGEISRIELPGAGALYEVTASGLNSAGAGKDETNLFRVHDNNVRVDHFGLLRVEAVNGLDPEAERKQLRALRDAARGHRVRVFDLPGCDFGVLDDAAEIVAGDTVELHVSAKGGGAENMSRLFMLTPADAI